MMIKISELKNRDVINIVDGRRLGVIHDLDIDLEAGVVRAIIVTGGSRMFNFFGGEKDCVIPWGSITKIGVDTILVELKSFSY